SEFAEAARQARGAPAVIASSRRPAAASGRLRPRPALPSRGHKFSGDINGLGCFLSTPKGPFLLASIAGFLYPIVCLACERPRDLGRAHHPRNACPRDSSGGRQRF